MKPTKEPTEMEKRARVRDPAQRTRIITIPRAQPYCPPVLEGERERPDVQERRVAGTKRVENRARLAQASKAVLQRKERDAERWNDFRAKYWAAIPQEHRDALVQSGVSPTTPEERASGDSILFHPVELDSASWWTREVLTPRSDASGIQPRRTVREKTEEELLKQAEDLQKGFER